MTKTQAALDLIARGLDEICAYANSKEISKAQMRRLIYSTCNILDRTIRSALKAQEWRDDAYKKLLCTYFPFIGLEHADAQRLCEQMETMDLAVMLETEKGSSEEYEYGNFVWRLTKEAEKYIPQLPEAK